MEDQIEIRMVIATRLFEWSLEEAGLLSKIIAGAESWVFTYNSNSEVSLLKGTQEQPPEIESRR
jgi:hypothetical protein